MKNTLHRWITDKGIPYADMAKTLGMKRGSLYRITNCEHWPRPELLALIETHTGGDVTATQLVADWVANSEVNRVAWVPETAFGAEPVA